MHSSRRLRLGLVLSTSAFALMLSAAPMAPNFDTGWLKSMTAGGGMASSDSHSSASANGAGASASAGGSASAHSEGATGNTADSSVSTNASATGNDTATDASTA